MGIRIVGYSQLLLPKMADPIAKEELEKIVKEAERVSQMVKHLSIWMETLGRNG